MNTKIKIDNKYLLQQLSNLLNIPSPSGYTDSIVHYMGEELKALGIPFELTRRGAIRADINGKQKSPDRALIAHLDTLGAMVKGLKHNGRLEIVPLGTWSSRFAEGARVSVFTRRSSKRGTILPLKASGHTYNEEIDQQRVSWDNLEVRVDEKCNSIDDLHELEINIGDYIAIDPQPEFMDSGFIVSRHLDDKAGVACVLAVAKAITEAKITLPVDCHLLFTLTEELGFGASHVLHKDVAEMVTIDNATPAPGQNSTEYGVTIAMKDMKGPFDYHLTHKLIELCEEKNIPYSRDVFIHYSSDATSALSAGNDIRTALICFGADASHGYERTHIDSLLALSELMLAYVQSPPTFQRDKEELGSIEGFPTQPLS